MSLITEFMAASGDKYNIKALDSVIGANSAELRDKILKQIPVDPRKTKQLASNLQLAEGERTEITVDVRTDDGMTNEAVQFDHTDVGEKTRHDNRHSHGLL